MAEINLGVGIGVSVPNLHMAEIVPELRFVAGALHLACAFPLAGLSSWRKETYADACFLGWKFPMEINLCGEDSSNRFLFRNIC